MIYKVNPMVTLGLSYKTPQIFTPLNWQSTGQFVPTSVNLQNFQVSGASGGAGEYSAHLNYPQQVAFGLAIRPIQPWLVSVEGQWINWANTLGSFNIYGPWNGTNVVSLPTHWQNQWVFNFGTQYDLTNWLQVRAGYVYGSNPIKEGADTTANLLFPAVVTNMVTFGATQKLGGGWKLTEAYMHAFANTNNGGPLLNGLQPLVQAGMLQNTSATLAENSYGFQIGYDF
jgi:long-chain fatty acid transport protein